VNDLNVKVAAAVANFSGKIFGYDEMSSPGSGFVHGLLDVDGFPPVRDFVRDLGLPLLLTPLLLLSLLLPLSLLLSLELDPVEVFFPELEMAPLSAAVCVCLGAVESVVEVYLQVLQGKECSVVERHVGVCQSGEPANEDSAVDTPHNLQQPVRGVIAVCVRAQSLSENGSVDRKCIAVLAKLFLCETKLSFNFLSLSTSIFFLQVFGRGIYPYVFLRV